MSKVNNVWVLSDNINRLDDVMCGAKELGEKVICFVIGNENDAKRAFALGADEVLLGKESEVFENFASSIAKELDAKEGIILMPNTKRCKAMAGILGAKLNAGVSTEGNEVKVNDGIECKKMMYGGLAVGVEKINSKIAIIVVNSGTFTPAEANFPSDKEAKELGYIEPKAAIKCIKKLPKTANSIDLNKAKRIVAIGRGITKEEDIAIARELCEIIGAELGCSRPIAEGEKWMEHERYIGISSVMPKPDIYVSIGISGQIQHMVGVKDAGKIIVINKDKNAPIFEYADCGIVGDLYKVVPALISALK